MKRKSNSGFTLIELLVVVSIIAIAFSAFIMLGFSFSDPEDLLEQEQQRLHARLQFAHEQGVMRGEDYGVRFNTRQYRFMRFEKNKWVDIVNDKLLPPQMLPDNMQLILALEGIEADLEKQDVEPEDKTENKEDTSAASNSENDDENQIKPQVFLLSSNETSPDFEVTFRFGGSDAVRSVHGNINGEYQLIK